MTTSLPSILQPLAESPIEQLEISLEAVRILKWHGFATLLDCAIFYYFDAHDTHASYARIFHKAVPFLYGEVEREMLRRGYWSAVTNAEVWDTIKYHRIRTTYRRIVHWEGRDQDLTDISLDILELPRDVQRTMEARYIRCLGDCVFYFVKENNDMVYEEAIKPRNVAFRTMMYEHIQPKLIELGLWRFVLENLDER